MLAGALNTAFAFLVYCTLVALGATLWIALFLGTLAGICFNFFSIGGYVFRDLAPRRVPRFVLAYLATYGINLRMIEWIGNGVGGPIVAQLILLLPMAALSYFILSRLVFHDLGADRPD